MSKILELNEKKHLEDATLNFTGNRIIGAIFMIAQVGHVFLRRNFGVRILKVDNILFTWSGLMLIAALADWITRLPFIGAKLDYATFRIFAIIYLIRAIYHLVKAYLEARSIPHRYTRHMGDSYVTDLITKFDIPFFRNNVMKTNAIAEPIVMFVIAEIIGRTLAPNLCIFLKIVSICMCCIGILAIQNNKKLLWDQNDSIVLGQHTQQNMKGTKSSAKKTATNRPTRSHTVNQPTKKNDRS